MLDHVFFLLGRQDTTVHLTAVWVVACGNKTVIRSTPSALGAVRGTGYRSFLNRIKRPAKNASLFFSSKGTKNVGEGTCGWAGSCPAPPGRHVRAPQRTPAARGVSAPTVPSAPQQDHGPFIIHSFCYSVYLSGMNMGELMFSFRDFRLLLSAAFFRAKP